MECFFLLFLSLSARAQHGITDPPSEPSPSPITSTTSDAPAPDKPADAGAEQLQKATQNPVATLISVPVQDNSNFNIGTSKRTQTVLNIQPVIPVSISKDWNVILAPWNPSPPIEISSQVNRSRCLLKHH